LKLKRKPPAEEKAALVLEKGFRKRALAGEGEGREEEMRGCLET